MKKEIYVKTIKELAGALGISPRRTADWVQKQGFPVKTAKGWPVEDCRIFYLLAKLRRLRPEFEPDQKWIDFCESMKNFSLAGIIPGN